MREWITLIELFQEKTNPRWEWEEEYESKYNTMTYIIKLADGSRYDLILEELVADGIWEISFAIGNGSYEITKTGNAPQVFAAIASCLRSFIKTMHPEGFFLLCQGTKQTKTLQCSVKKNGIRTWMEFRNIRHS